MSWLSTSLDLSHINHFRTHNRKLVASYKKMKYLEPNLVGVKVVILPVYCIWNFWKGWIKIQKKNHTHMKKVGHTSEFSFGIYWWTLKNTKNQNFEKMKKNCWRYHNFTHVYQKQQSYEEQLLRYRVRQIFLSFWAIFFISWDTKCKRQGFVNMGHFLAFDPSNNRRNQNFEKKRPFWRYCHFTHEYHK